MLNNQLPLQRLIGKIDNDFNIDHSDWIPRVGAWVTDALSQMKILPTQCKTRTLEVVDRIAIFPCDVQTQNLTIYDKNGCPVEPADADGHGCGCGCGQHSNNQIVRSFPVEEIAIFDDDHDDNASIYGNRVAKVINGTVGRTYTFIPPNKFELNYDTDSITVKSNEVATYYDDYFDCDVPYIYDDGLLLEALAWYCLFKILSRGYKHQVFDIKASQPHLNPYIQWMQLKPKAASSVKIALKKHRGKSGWGSFFYNFTFTPRD